ncbi:UvrABC system protein C [Candidatus Kinetoplastibacterium sorsogonicusi]|uniref:UvrABC system protein C n=1 Tax=Candidatus Kinetoplastidibacterium kentomonadis TaxID=1576550 RepID=A0A3S7J9H0_9PROT|nr:excinuclease ABC subunit UvrC [Candidatus Kinetoplastibacterium sorsogonicusi]AWD32309.1 UvrABC system protein C [Candidatus Kinetoplastibacterium sorsogonicusi]
MLIKSEIKNILKNLPNLPGIYKHLDSDENILYIGKAKNLKKRITSYFNRVHDNQRIKLLVSKISNIEITITNSEEEALLLEYNLIKKYNPKYNIIFKDDKSYPYIFISHHKWPGIFYYKGKINSKGNFFGPYLNSNTVKNTIDIIQKIFFLRTCEDSSIANRSRPCILYQINKCSAPCKDKISLENYSENVSQAINFLNGKTNSIIKNIKQKMIQASNYQDFEYASKLKNQLIALNNIIKVQTVNNVKESDIDVISVVLLNNQACVNLSTIRNGHHFGDKSFFPDNIEYTNESSIITAFIQQHYVNIELPKHIILSHKIKEKSNIFLLKKFIPKLIYKPIGIKKKWLEQNIKNNHIALSAYINKNDNNINRLSLFLELINFKKLKDNIRIECFDISHMSGESTYGSCVVFEKNKMQPSMYRRYKIDNISMSDDYGAMSQILLKRFSKKLENLPDIILIDGGKGHINIANKVLNQLNLANILIIGVAKGNGRKPGLEKLVFTDRADILLGEKSIILMFINHIRDEAHRFAINGMRYNFTKLRKKSILESINGIGLKRRKMLLNKFGSLSSLYNATIEELSSIKGISMSLAEKIYYTFHND